MRFPEGCLTGRPSFHSSSSFKDTLPHLWEDEEGVVHEIPQGEVLFTLVSTKPWKQSRSHCSHPRTLMAFLDDVYVTTPPERTATVEQSVEVNLWTHARIQVNQGKTQVWNRCGERPPDCNQLFSRTDGTPNDVLRGHHCPRHSSRLCGFC